MFAALRMFRRRNEAPPFPGLRPPAISELFFAGGLCGCCWTVTFAAGAGACAGAAARGASAAAADIPVPSVADVVVVSAILVPAAVAVAFTPSLLAPPSLLGASPVLPLPYSNKSRRNPSIFSSTAGGKTIESWYTSGWIARTRHQ